MEGSFDRDISMEETEKGFLGVRKAGFLAAAEVPASGELRWGVIVLIFEHPDPRPHLLSLVKKPE